jgi:hypothetical protein
VTESDARLKKARVLDRKIRALAKNERRAKAELAYAVARMNAERLYRSLGFESIVEYCVDAGVAMSRWQARDMVKTVESLPKYPEIERDFRQGVVCWTKTREGVKALDSIKGGPSPKQLKEWRERIRTASYRDVERASAKQRGVELKVRVSAAVTEAQEADIQQAIRVKREQMGNRHLTDGEALALICKDSVQTIAATGDGRSGVRRVINDCPKCGTCTVEGRDGPAEVSRAEAEMAECNGETLDIRHGPARVTKNVPKSVATYVHARDRGRCRVDGCRNMGFLHKHHVGGRKKVGHDPDRMLLLCEEHHAACHDGSMRMWALGKGAFRFRLADGSRVRAAPLRQAG